MVTSLRTRATVPLRARIHKERPKRQARISHLQTSASNNATKPLFGVGRFPTAALSDIDRGSTGRRDDPNGRRNRSSPPDTVANAGVQLMQGQHLIISHTRPCATPSRIRRKLVVQTYVSQCSGSMICICHSAQSKAVGRRALLPGVHDAKGGSLDAANHKHLHRHLRLNYGSQSMLPVKQISAGINGYTLMAESPFSTTHRRRITVHRRRVQEPIIYVLPKKGSRTVSVQLFHFRHKSLRGARQVGQESPLAAIPSHRPFLRSHPNLMTAPSKMIISELTLAAPNAASDHMRPPSKNFTPACTQHGPSAD